MRRLGLAMLIVCVVGLAAPGGSAQEPEDCQYVQVVDACVYGVLVLDVGGNAVLNRIALNYGDAGSYAPGGVDYSTVPGYDELYSFVAQGPFLQVLDLTRTGPWRTFDTEGVGGLAGVSLHRLDAAGPVTVGSQTRYPLYAIGSVAGDPWFLVFDQEALLSDTLDPGAVLLAAGPVHTGCADCPGIGLDVAAGGPPAEGGVQEAYASVLDTSDGDYRLRIHRIVIHEDFSFDVTLDPWNDEGLPFDGSAVRANGLDYDSSGTQPFGVFQTTSVVRNLSSGESSCPLAGHPTDVAVWGPGAAMEHPDFLFVTSRAPDGSDLLIGFPAGECPDGNPASLVLPLTGLPRALVLSSATSDTPWVYTANRYGLVTAVPVRLDSDPQDGDRIDLLETFDLPMSAACPYAVAIRNESYHQCVDFSQDGQTAKPPRIDCDEDPDDPRCAKDLADKGSADSEEP